MVHAVTIEREFGCGASEIASLVANRLGFSLWDERLTQEIAQLTESTQQAVEQREWRTDSVSQLPRPETRSPPSVSVSRDHCALLAFR
jgi:hypothetical protein